MDSLILLSVEHNLKLMHQLSSERKFGNIIEAARSAKSWQQLRAYLDVFDEYCTYLSVRRKTQALAFLYELLIHRRGISGARQPASSERSSPNSTWSTARSSPTTWKSDPAEEVPFTLWEQYLDMIIYRPQDHPAAAQPHQLHPEAGGGRPAGVRPERDHAPLHRGAAALL